MTVEIKIIGEDAGHALRELKGLSSGLLASTSTAAIVGAYEASEPKTATEIVEREKNGLANENPAARERGKPASGRARRTKEEIAEDDAAEKSAAQAISTGGERVGPEDDEETAAQDKADEQAEVEAARKPEAPLTVDDVKAAVGLYVNKFSMDAAVEDGPALFVSVLGEPPAGNPFWKMSILPDDQKKLKACVDAWQSAAAADTRYGA